MIMTHNLDARRLLCPLPIIKVQERVKKLNPGDILKIVCTDKGSLSDIAAWCRIHGHYFLSSNVKNREIFITIKISIC